jgi:hypothetical protein
MTGGSIKTSVERRDARRQQLDPSVFSRLGPAREVAHHFTGLARYQPPAVGVRGGWCSPLSVSTSFAVVSPSPPRLGYRRQARG